MSTSSASLAKQELATFLAEKARRKQGRQLDYYEPYPKQREFHAAGAVHRERLFMAGNQLGKTWAGGFEVAMHATGEYPDWWEGRRWDGPIRAWVAGVTGESTRDNPQRILLGPPQQPELWGTAALPLNRIARTQKGRGVPDGVDSVVVEHVNGGESIIVFKSYEKGRAKWQGETLDLIWYDEEPSPDIYSEGLARLNARMGMAMTTFTPLLGMSEVVQMFLTEDDLKAMQ